MGYIKGRRRMETLVPSFLVAGRSFSGVPGLLSGVVTLNVRIKLCQIGEGRGGRRTGC